MLATSVPGLNTSQVWVGGGSTGRARPTPGAGLSWEPSVSPSWPAHQTGRILVENIDKNRRPTTVTTWSILELFIFSSITSPSSTPRSLKRSRISTVALSPSPLKSCRVEPGVAVPGEEEKTSEWSPYSYNTRAEV